MAGVKIKQIFNQLKYYNVQILFDLVSKSKNPGVCFLTAQ